MRVFISSVVSGFEEYRAAAKRAVETLDGVPAMCEDFGARPYSSERACITEIESSDVFVLLLGSRFGYEQAPGISVTQQEFRHACALPLPVLAFVQETTMEPEQETFRTEVEAYHAGFSRERFSTPEEMKEKIIQTLSRFERARAAVPESQFEQRLEEASRRDSWSGNSYDATFSFTYFPQPQRDLDLRQLEAKRDETFSLLGKIGLASLKDGYAPIDDPNHTGLKAGHTILRQYDDGLLILDTKASAESPSHSFASWYVPPSRIRTLAGACFQLVRSNGGWCRIALKGMENATMTELPSQPSNSFSMGTRGEKVGAQNGLLVPCTQSIYSAWVDKAVAKLERQFGPRS